VLGDKRVEISVMGNDWRKGSQVMTILRRVLLCNGCARACRVWKGSEVLATNLVRGAILEHLSIGRLEVNRELE
jgi:hypothetical protein